MYLMAEGVSTSREIAATRISAVCAAALAVTSCGAFDSRVEWQSGPYAVVWIDEPSNSKLSYRVHADTSVPVVDACISAIADNAQFIGARQRPPGSREDERYFVVRKQQFERDVHPTPDVTGPLSVGQYALLAARLKLPGLASVGIPEACDPKGAEDSR